MNKIFTIFLALILISCENNIPFNQLEHDEQFTYHENKKFTGVAIEKDDLDNIRIEKYYEDGKNYLTKLYDSKKRIQSEWTYNNISVKVTRYHKDGSIESKENFNPNYKRNGKSISYYKNGNLKNEWNFKNGLKHGIQKNYYPNGSISDEREMKNGVDDGFWKIYDRNGKLDKELYFKNGLRVGI